MENNNSDAPVLVHFDESQYNITKVKVDTALGLVQQVVNQYKGLNLPPLAKGELGELFINPEEVIFFKMTGGQAVSIAGLEVHVHKAMEILKKPVGYDNLLSLISEAKESFKKTGTLNHHQVEEVFEMDAEGVVTLNPAKEERMKSLHRRFATSKIAKSTLALSKSILAQVDELGLTHIANTHREGFGGFLSELFETSGFEQRKTVVSIRSIEAYNRR